MGSIADLYATVRADMSKFGDELGVGLKKEGAKAGTTFAGSFRMSMANVIKGGFGLGIGLGAANLAAGGVKGLVDSMGDAVSAASDLSESQSKVNVVFAEGAEDVTRWADNAAEGFGMSKQAALEAAGTFGNFIQALGSTREEAQDMSTQLVELAADLASFNNADPTEVILALRSGLSGEAEPMRRFGVALSVARENAILAARGIQKVNGVFKDSDRVMARYLAIMEDTKLAQGDFARTSDGLANSQRILNAHITDLQANLGQLLLPVVTDAVHIFSDLAVALAGPRGVAKTMTEYIARQKEAKGVTEDTNDALEDQNAGLGFLEASWADVPFAGDFMPHLKEATLLWRENSKELMENGQTFQDWREAFFRAKDDLGLGADAALELTLKLAGVEKATRRLAAAHAKDAREDAEAVARREELNTALDGSLNVIGFLRASTTALTATVRRAGEAAFQSADGWQELASQVDLAKGSFGDFWKSVRQDQRQAKFFIRHPDKLREEIKKIESALERSEDRKRKLLKDGYQKRDALALEAEDRLQEKLRNRADGFRAIGIAQGRALGSGMESGFDPRLVINASNIILNGLDAVKSRIQSIFGDPNRATGGPVSAGVPYIVGEARREVFVPDTNGTIKPTVGPMAAGGDTYNIPIELHGLPMQARTPSDVVYAARRAARLGILPARRQTAWSRP